MQQSPQLESGEGIMELLLKVDTSLLSTMRMRNKAVGLLDSKNPYVFSALSFQLLTIRDKALTHLNGNTPCLSLGFSHRLNGNQQDISGSLAVIVLHLHPSLRLSQSNIGHLQSFHLNCCRSRSPSRINKVSLWIVNIRR